MKYLFLLLLLVGCGSSSQNTHDWTDAERFDFLIQCKNEGGTVDFCTCALERVEEEFQTEEDFFKSNIAEISKLLIGC